MTDTREQEGLTRRRALAGSAAAAGGLVVAAGPLNQAQIARARKRPFAGEGSFDWGVSSGFPAPRGIVLWTRIDGLDRTSRVRYEVATDRQFRRVVKRGFAVCRRRKDFTVHVAVNGLRPASEYFYRFYTRRSNSRVGQFRTSPPPDSMQPIKIGFFSCQNYQAGYYNAHDGLAAEKDLDLVICLGDYIYENRTYPGPRTDNSGNNGDGDCQKLEEYRQKYRLYQSDRSLQDAQAAHPMIAIWDDHEVEDNYAGKRASSAASDGQTNPGEPRRVPIGQRVRNGYHAFFDAMPRKRRRGDPLRTFERARLGRMADLFLLDERQYRDPQPCNDAPFVPCPDANAPRAMLGRPQMGWLKDRLERSPAQWKLLGNQLMLMSFDVALGASVTKDSWDGYGAERSELGNHILDKGIDNVVAMTGDIHTFFAGRMTTTGRIDGTPYGVEFVGGSVTSLGVKETLGNVDGIENIETVLPVADPHIIYADFDRRGYGVLSLNREEARCDFRSPKTVMKKGSQIETIASFRVAAGSTNVEQI